MIFLYERPTVQRVCDWRYWRTVVTRAKSAINRLGPENFGGAWTDRFELARRRSTHGVNTVSYEQRTAYFGRGVFTVIRFTPRGTGRVFGFHAEVSETQNDAGSNVEWTCILYRAGVPISTAFLGGADGRRFDDVLTSDFTGTQEYTATLEITGTDLEPGIAGTNLNTVERHFRMWVDFKQQLVT